jgi:hypothetical protein
MGLCIRRGLAQLAYDDDNVTTELRRIGAASTAGESTAR